MMPAGESALYSMKEKPPSVTSMSSRPTVRNGPSPGSRAARARSSAESPSSSASAASSSARRATRSSAAAIRSAARATAA
ncbi:hypothetical protein WMF28_10500 [Sorangium sp. So ce590]|uniref:hypothetical protein n=1 Tax=Sorangium sp. So ce590 TaxID=3133317 RepID=UPI003F61C0EB